MSENSRKTHFNIALPKEYVKAMDIVEEGVYLSSQEIMRDALRFIFRLYEIKPFIKILDAVE